MIPGGMGVPVKRTKNILSTISIFLATITVLLSVGVFLYQEKLTKDNDEKKQKIENEIKAFDPEPTNKLAKLKLRVDSAKELLKNHLALTNFFDLLNDNTVSTIQFKDFTYTGGPGKPLVVKMTGKSQNFNDLIFQSDTFLANPNLKNVVFSDFDLDEDGNVVFTVSAEINAPLVSYQKILEDLSSNVSDNTIEDVPVTPVETSTSTASTTITTP